MAKKPTKDKPKFTVKQQRFVDFYDGNASEAMIKAGYNPKYAATNSQKILKLTKIIDAIKNREQKRTKGPIATREERQEFWTKAMRNTDIDIKDRLKSSELMGKSEADFTEKIEQSGDLVVKIVRFSE